MAIFGLVVHEGRHQAAEEALSLARWLTESGHEVRTAVGDAVPAELADSACPDEEFAVDLDLAVSLGGDGSILRTVELVADRAVPVLGVNHGQLGYLTEVEPESARPAIERWLAGDTAIEDRMMLAVTVHRSGHESVVYHALNEMLLERTAGASTIRMAVSIDGEFFTSYAADGLIVATPTGSTAYAFSARGPIVAATHRSMQLTPVSPHMLFDRTLVLDAESRIDLQVRGHRPAAVSLDGRTIAVLSEHDSVQCTASTRVARLVTLGPRSFHQVLKVKFGLNDR